MWPPARLSDLPESFPKDENIRRELESPTDFSLPFEENMPAAPFSEVTPAFFLRTRGKNNGWKPAGPEYAVFEGTPTRAVKFVNMSAPAAGADEDDTPMSALHATRMSSVSLPPVSATAARFQVGDLIEIKQMDDFDFLRGAEQPTTMHLRASTVKPETGVASFVPARVRGTPRISSLIVRVHEQGVKTNKVKTVDAKGPLIVGSSELFVPDTIHITHLWRDESDVAVVHLKLKEPRSHTARALAKLSEQFSPPLPQQTAIVHHSPVPAIQTTPANDTASLQQRLRMLETEVGLIRTELRKRNLECATAGEPGMASCAQAGSDAGSEPSSSAAPRSLRAASFCAALTASSLYSLERPGSLPDYHYHAPAAEQHAEAWMENAGGPHKSAAQPRGPFQVPYEEPLAEAMNDIALTEPMSDVYYAGAKKVVIAPFATTHSNAKNQLQEWCMHRSRRYNLPEYSEPCREPDGIMMRCRVKVTSARGDIILDVLGDAQTSLKAATMAAANNAMRKIHANGIGA